MIELVNKKIANNEYISNALYEQLNISGFDVDKYNANVLSEMYEKYKEYFSNMFKGIDDNISLDEEQIKAILAEEDNALIIAGAGTGKTTAMVAKVKYLVDIKKVDPSKILVMSYTKKATEELEKRIVDDFHIPAHVTTFHSLGYEYIRQIFKTKKCSVIDYNEKDKIFYEYFVHVFNDKEKLQDIMNIFDKNTIKKSWIFSKFFKENYLKYDTYEEFLKAYKNKKIEEAKELGLSNVINNWIKKKIFADDVITIQGEYVKSASEAIIANFLFTHGIDYEYEKIYEELMDDNKIYKPDFTLDFGGIPVYIEYFGVDDPKYNKIKKVKKNYHKIHNNIFIEFDKTPLDLIELELDKKLKEIGFKYNIKSDEVIYDRILDNNPISQVFPLKNFFYSIIDAIKESNDRDNYTLIIKEYIDKFSGEERQKMEREFKYINEFYAYYQQHLYDSLNYKFDYPDLLYYASKYIENIGINNRLSFDYIIIDEYQDISKSKYELTSKTALRNNAKVFAVGDDWQSIYAFSGSRIDYIYNFSKYFPGSKIFQITKTYRNSQELIDKSGEFIMKNDSQIKKNLISDKHIDNPIVFVPYDSNIELFYDGEFYSGYQEYQYLKRLILNIHNKNKNHTILILARRNKTIDMCFKDKDLIDDLGTKIKYVGYEDIELDAMTMHKSKGLTFDEVIVIGLSKNFPIGDYGKYWVIDLFKNETFVEDIPYAEERRLFYVALTRTKNKVYLLVDKDVKKRSAFVEELYKICFKE